MAVAWTRRLAWPALLVGALLIVGTVYWQTRGYHRPPAETDALVVVASGDTAGWIVPCGCTANQSGGLLRRGSYLNGLRTAHDVIYVDVGGAAGGASPYHEVKFEAILRGEAALGIAAHNLGGPELRFRPETLKRLGAIVPFISANVRDGNGQLIAEPLRIVQCGGKRFALTGVVSRAFATSPAWRIDDPRESILGVIADHKGRYESLIVLAYLPEEELQGLASALPEADVVLGGPTGQSIAPRPVGPAILAAATNKGKFLVELHLQPPMGERRWAGTVVELGEGYHDDPGQLANVREYLARLAEMDFTASDSGFVQVLSTDVPRGYAVAGNAACVKCHAADCQHWDGTKHALAWGTLETRGYHVDSYCQQCHTTGFGLPGGFVSAARSGQQRSVGCESCHGPSQAHALEPRVKTPFVARDQCVRCHDRENSPRFAYDEFWSKIKHGVKAQ